MTTAEAAAVRERLLFARNMLRDARNTLALIRQARIDAMGSRSTHAEQRAHYVLEEQLAGRRVREWNDRVTTLEASARFLGVDEAATAEHRPLSSTRCVCGRPWPHA